MATHNVNGPRRVPEPYTEQQQVHRTYEWIAACNDIVEMRADLDRQFPECSIAELDHFMATLIIGNNLGHDWVARHIEKREPRTGAGSYLRSKPTDSLERHEHYVRVMELARRVFELGQEPFAERLLDNLRRRDLEGAMFEADVVRMLIAAPSVVDLREEQGTKGDDYDIDLWLRPDQCWSIEAKTRADDAPYSGKALTRTLDRARSQLPEDGIGAIFLKVPTPWLGDCNYRRNSPDVVAGFLCNTNRVHAIVLVWDEWTPKASGRGLNWRRAFRIFRAGGMDDTVEHLLNLYDQIWEAPWDIGPCAPF